MKNSQNSIKETQFLKRAKDMKRHFIHQTRYFSDGVHIYEKILSIINHYGTYNKTTMR